MTPPGLFKTKRMTCKVVTMKNFKNKIVKSYVLSTTSLKIVKKK